jgi:molybdate transport system substrate-binding protein
MVPGAMLGSGKSAPHPRQRSACAAGFFTYSKRGVTLNWERQMKISITNGRNTLGSVIVLAGLTVTAMSASAAEIRVMSGGAPQGALAVLTPEFEKQTGHTVKYKVAVYSALRQALDAGEKTDMVLMPVPMIDSYVKAGKMRAEGRATLGQVGVTVIVRQGAAQPDISTPESFRMTLLDARSVVYSTPTATPSGAHMAKVIEQLGIADAMQQKTVHRPALNGGADLVAKGEVEIGMYPTSAVMHVKGITLVGPLPAALQLSEVFAAAVSTDNVAPEPALAFIKFLADPTNRRHWKEAGFDPPEK